MKMLGRSGMVALALLAGCAHERVEEIARPLLSIDDLLRMSQAHVGEKTIIAKIQTSRIDAKLTPDDLISLKNRGLSDEVLAELVRAAGPLAPTHVIVHRYGPPPGWYDPYWDDTFLWDGHHFWW